MANKNNRKNTSKVKSNKTYNRRQKDSGQNIKEKKTGNSKAGEGRANKRENIKRIIGKKKASRTMSRESKDRKEFAQKTKHLTRRDKRLTHVKNKSKQYEYIEMILKAFSAVVKPTNLSWQAIVKYIDANFEVEEKTTANRQLKIALKWCITNKYLKQIGGQGANKSFALLRKTKRSATKRNKTAAKPEGSTSSTKTKMSQLSVTKDKQRDSLKSASCRLEKESPGIELPRQDEEMIEVGKTSPLSGQPAPQSASVDAETSSRQKNEATESQRPLSQIKAVKKYTFDLNTFFGSKNKYDEISTRSAITEDGRIFFSDFSNNRVSAFSKNPVMKLLGCVTVREVPRGIAVLNGTEIVVCTDRKYLVIINTTRPKPKIVDKIKLPFKIRAVTKHRDKFVVTCLAYRDVIASVKLIDRAGIVYWSVSHDSEDQPLFASPFYISSQNNDISSAVIVSDYRMKTLTMLNADTGSVVTRRHVTENEPFGVTTDTAGNVYVCYPKKVNKQEIAVFSSDLSEEKTLLSAEDGLYIFPVSIVYDNCARELFIGHTTCSIYECFELL